AWHMFNVEQQRGYVAACYSSGGHERNNFKSKKEYQCFSTK
ncbi:21598_t:CDS:1, partial [Gigaspora rosea]